MLTARLRRTWLLPAALALAALPACRTASSHADLRALRAEAAPTLEEIFLLPGIQGRPPRLDRLSADGRWVYFRFTPLAVAEDGARKLVEDGALRVLSTEAPDDGDRAGVSVDALLPPLPPPAAGEKQKRAGRVELALARHGGRALALRGQELFLLEPPADPRGAWRATLLLAGGGEGAFGKLSSPRFDEEDDAVLVETELDLWRFPLAKDARPSAPWTDQDGVNLTATIEAPVGKLAFSRNLDVVFAREPAVGKLDVPATEGSPALQRDAEILWRASGALVELEGQADLGTIERTQLSPDGRFLFASVVDRANDGAPTLIPDYLSPRVSTREGRRDLAEDGPAPRKLYLWDTASGVRTELTAGDGELYWLRTIGWAPQREPGDPARLAFARLSPDFRTLETFLWTEASGLVRILVDQDERWIGGPVDRARWTGDGARLVFGSETFPTSTTPGHAQLFAFDTATGAVRQLTRASGEVASFDVGEDGTIAFSHNTADAPDRFQLAWISPAGVLHEVATPRGSSMDPEVASDGSRAVFMHSRMFQPAELFAVEFASGAAAALLTRTASPEFLARDWIRPRRFHVAGPLGARVWSHVFLPRASSLERPDRPRPAVVFIHGAGYLQNVTDSMTEYEQNLLFHSRLAEMGYVVVDVDYRGSAGYGGRFRTDAQFKLGELELQDIAATVDELARRGVVDARRVGCYGGSYGGFLVLMALFTEGERWSAGAALRSVTDWRTYHPGYTQPRLGKPSTHPEAYARSSPLDHAEGLSKPLLLLHGMMDSNVFAQDTIRLMEKLIDLGKEFDVMLYPSQDHAFTDGAHWLDEYKRIERFLMEHLGVP